MRDLWMRWGVVVVGMMLVGQTMPSSGEGSLKELADHWAGLKDVRTLTARFVCEKALAALDTPLHSEGRLWIGKGDGGAKDEGTAGVRFSTEKPYVSELILSGGKVFARSQHETEWTKTNQAARPGLTAVMGQLGGWSTGDSSKIAEMYSVAKSSEPVPAVPLDDAEKTERAADVFVLTPTNADLAKSVKSVTLALDRQTNLLRYIQILTQQDDVTRYWFLEVKGNAALPADVFKAGTELMVPGEMGERGAVMAERRANGFSSGWISDALASAGEFSEGRPLLLSLMVRWTRILAGHRIALSILLLGMGGVSALSARIAWQADVLQFFSANADSVRNVRAAGERSGVANYLRLDVYGKLGATGARADDAALLAATRGLSEKLRASGEFRSVWIGRSEQDFAKAFGDLVAQGPAILTDAERAEVAARATPEFLDKRFAEVREKLADPDGEFLLAQLRSDPLDLAGIVGEKLRSLSPGGKGGTGAGGAGPTMQDGVLVARDSVGGLHAMIVADPFSRPSDQSAAERTLAATNQAVASVEAEHPEIGVWVVGAHRGYVENAQRVKADVTLVSIVGTLLVGLAIAIYFRRVSTALLCIIPPSVGVGVALGLAGAMRVELPLILLGFAGLLCGSTTDYGIQLIAECRRLARVIGGWDADIPAVAARRLLGPISMSVATSVTGFSALGLSESPGLRALGLFVAGATICIWGVTFLVLPAYLGRWVLPKVGAARARKPWSVRWIYWAGSVAFLGATVWLGRTALHVRFNTDARALDGSSNVMLAEERAFFDVWGDMRNRALVLVSGTSAEDVLRRAGRVDAFLRDEQRDGMIAGMASAAAILPDQTEAERRIAAWNAIWTPERTTALRVMLAAAAKSNGFKGDAFAGCVDRIGRSSVASARDRLISSPAGLFPGFVGFPSKGSGDITLATIVDLRTDRSLRQATGWAQELQLRYPEVVILSGQMLIFDATERARAEAERLAPWCLLAILLPLWGYFRRLRMAWLAMVCLVVGFVWVLGAAQLFAGGLNLLSLVPVLFTLGVAVDYGVYAASDPAWKKDGGGEGNRLAATFLCAMTTILGSGALIIAGHPVLRWLGITLVAGISGGYLASLFIVAQMMRWMGRPRMTKKMEGKAGSAARVAGRWAIGLGVAALSVVLLIPPAVQVILSTQRPTGMTAVTTPVRAEQIGPRAYAFQNSWMRWRATSDDSGMWEITAVGTPVERGLALAALASPIDVRIENEMLDQLDYFLPEEWARWLVLRGVAANLATLPSYVAPEYQQEIFASATSYADPHEYLAPPYPRILSYHALHDVSQMLIDNPLIVPNTFACTGVVSLPVYTNPRGGGDLLVARVFDFEGGESFGRQKSITYVIPPAGDGIPFAHVAWPGLAGAVTGMNVEKVALFINAAATRDFRRIGTPTILMARDILEHAHSIADAERIIRATQVFVSDIIVVADGKTGTARVFEKSPARMDSYDVTESAVVTNHLVTATFADDPVNKERRDDGTTMQRYARARQLLDRMKGRGEVTVEGLSSLLRDKHALDDKDVGYGNRNAIDGLIACHAVIMDVTKGEMWVAGWPNAEGAFIGVDVMAMLKGASTHPMVSAPASPAGIPADTMMADGTWQRVVAAREAATSGEDALRNKQFVTARDNAATVVRNNPKFYLGHELMGRALFGMGDKRGAKDELSRAMLLDPPYAERRYAIEGLMQRCDMP